MGLLGILLGFVVLRLLVSALKDMAVGMLKMLGVVAIIFVILFAIL